MDTCRSCGAKVIWANNQNGNRMILDAEPAKEGGNIILMADGTCHVLKKKDVTGCPDALHKSHHATCPDAAKWRKKR